jgi:hypothetical protein
MLDLLERLRKEWHVIKGAPFSFMIVCVVVITAGYGCIRWYYSDKLKDATTRADQWRSDVDYWKDQAGRKPGCPAPEVKKEPNPENPTPEKSTPSVKRIPNTAQPKPPSISQSNNSGGINVLQGSNGQNSPIVNSPITVGTLPKHIQPNDALTLTDYLLKAKNSAVGVKIVVAADQFSRSSPFVDEFYNVFHDAQWPMKDNGVNGVMTLAAPAAKRFQGAMVTIKGEPLKPGESVNISAPDPLYYVASVLQSLNVDRSLNRDPKAEEGLIIIQFQGGFPN